ncbi:MAG: hypothetical protein ACI4T6_01540, partial [Candidatus Flemingiibacterium sp.]
MNNKYFNIAVDESSGCIASLKMPDDEHGMNWCADGGLWGRIHFREMKLVSCISGADSSESVYEGKGLSVRFRRGFGGNGNYVESCTLTNISDTGICINRDNFGIEFPFNDRYTNADECMVRHCHTHIWCGHDTAWINALRMGASELNLGLFLTEGSFDCYCQDGCKSNDRGLFILCPTSFFLKSGESYTLGWEVFRHSGNEDFFARLSEYERFIDVRAEHYTIFTGESVKLTIKCRQKPEIFCRGEKLTVTADGRAYKAEYTPASPGEYRFEVKSCGNSTWADVMVKI